MNMPKRRRRNSTFGIREAVPLRLPSYLKTPLAFGVGLAIGYGVFNATDSSVEISLAPSSVKACFTPGNNCEARVISLIAQAQHEILVHAYGFTSANIAEALLSAHVRGVYVAVLYDQKAARERYSQIAQLQQAGIKTIPDKVKGIAHNKVILIDNSIVVTGSHNWTNGARDKNSENIVIISNSELAEEYRKNWKIRSE